MLTKYRLSVHTLALETERYKKQWLQKEERLQQECGETAVETELDFLTYYPKFKSVQEEFFPIFTSQDAQSINCSWK